MRAALASLVLFAACERPRPLVICHNANCTGDTSPSRADTIEGLRAALALEYDGRPLIDGIELDIAWDATTARCTFAHDLESAPTRADIITAVDEILAWATTTQHPLIVVLDVKTGPEPALLAACAADAADRLYGVVTVFLSSADPDLARRLADEQPIVPFLAGFASPRPLGSAVPLADFEGIELFGVSAHPRWLTDQQLVAMRDAGLAIFLWTHILTDETLDTIERFEPHAVGTDDVELLRAWIER